MTTLTVDEEILEQYLKNTKAPIVSDEELEVWANYYTSSDVLRGMFYFDRFMRAPVQCCKMARCQ